jgi:hypothetical protein
MALDSGRVDAQTGLVNFAKQQKMDPGDPNLQAKFLLYELEGPEKESCGLLKRSSFPRRISSSVPNGF